MPSHAAAAAAAALALAGSQPEFAIHDGNFVSFLLNRPFSRDSRWTKGAPECNAGSYIEYGDDATKVALVEANSGKQWTYEQLKDNVYKVASYLRTNLRLQPAEYRPGGPREPIVSPVVLLHLPNSYAFVVSELATWAAGLTVTTVNFAYTPTELSHVISAACPAVIITSSGGGVETVDAALKQSSQRAQDSLSGRIFVVGGKDGEHKDWGEMTTQSPFRGGKARFAYDTWKHPKEESKRRAALILWSSGTSGKSKGVVIAHEYLSFGMQSVWYGSPHLGNDEVFLGLPPFFHIFGLSNVMLLSIALGGTNVCIDKFHPVTYLEVAQKYKATHLHVAPPIAVLLAKSPLVGNYNIKSVRGATSGGAPLGPSIIKEVWERLGFLIRMSYGTSENASVSQTYAKSWKELEPCKEATGRPYPGVQVKVIPTVSGSQGSSQVLTRGEVGELLIKSPSSLICYLDAAQATREAIDDQGWYHTGDVGYIDANDNVYITDRLKELIKVKGFQVAPAELEAILNSHPKVADAGVTSLYSEKEATEWPIAYIVPADQSIVGSGRQVQSGSPSKAAVDLVNELNRFVESQTISYKWIKGGMVLASAIPKSNSGKLLRREFKTVKGININLYTDPKVKAKL